MKRLSITHWRGRSAGLFAATVERQSRQRAKPTVAALTVLEIADRGGPDEVELVPSLHRNLERLVHDMGSVAQEERRVGVRCVVAIDDLQVARLELELLVDTCCASMEGQRALF